MSLEEKQQRAAHQYERQQLRSMDGKSRRRGKNSKWDSVPIPGPRKPKPAKSGPLSSLPVLQNSSPVPIVSFVRTAVPDGNGFTMQQVPNTGQYQLSSEIPMDTGWGQAVMNGVVDPGKEPRYPDPFRLSPSSVITVQQNWTNTCSATTSTSSTLADFAIAYVLKGDPVVSAWQVPMSGGIPAVAPDWRYAVRVSGITYPAGMANGDFYSRPNGIVWELSPLLRGIEHTVTVNAMPILPWNSSAFTVAAMPGWFTDVRMGPTGYQRYIGARQWTYKPGDEAIRLVCLPVDSRCLDFSPCNAERLGINSDALLGWTGWIVTMYGFTSADIMTLRSRYVEEVMPIGYNTVTNYAFPSSTRKADPIMGAKAVNEVMEAAQAGATGIKVVDKIASWVGPKVRAVRGLWNAIEPFIGSDLQAFPLPSAPPLVKRPDTEIAFSKFAAFYGPPPPVQASQAAEQKEDDFTPVDPVIKTRRNTLSTPLTLDTPKEPQTPASARRTK